MDEQKPGDVISPRTVQDTDSEVSVQIPRSNPVEQPAPQPESLSAEPPVSNPVVNVPEAPTALPQPEQPAQPFVSIDTPAPSSAQDTPQSSPFNPQESDEPMPNEEMSWTASEFIHHAKSLNWFLVVGIVGLLGAVSVYFLTHDLISTIVIAVVAVIFGVSAASKPRVLPYEINGSGVQIGSKHYSYADFKTFGVVHEGNAFSKIELMPLKRFAAPVSMHIPPEEEEAIIRTLSEFLPYEERKPDATDRLLNKIRF